MILTTSGINLLSQGEQQKMLDLSGNKFIASVEGVRYTAYLDSVGVWTIGRGITYYENGSPIKKGDTVTAEREEALFQNTVKFFVKKVNEYVKKPVNQNQFNALVSFCYNIGTQAFKTSTLLKKVNVNPADKTIANEFMKWVKGTVKGKKVTIAGLVNRRKKEVELYYKV